MVRWAATVAKRYIRKQKHAVTHTLMTGVPGPGGGTISGNVGRRGAHQWIQSLGGMASEMAECGVYGYAAHKGCTVSQVH